MTKGQRIFFLVPIIASLLLLAGLSFLERRSQAFLTYIKAAEILSSAEDPDFDEVSLLISPLSLVSHQGTLEYLYGIAAVLQGGRSVDHPQHRYRFVVIDNSKHPDMGTRAKPSGLILIGSADVMRADSEAEIAGLISHEMGHVVLRHSAKREAYQRRMQDTLQNGKLSYFDSFAFGKAVDTLLLESLVSPQIEADAFALSRLNGSGYSAHDFANCLKKNLDLKDQLGKLRFGSFVGNTSYKERMGRHFIHKTKDEFARWKIAFIRSMQGDEKP